MTILKIEHKLEPPKNGNAYVYVTVTQIYSHVYVSHLKEYNLTFLPFRSTTPYKQPHTLLKTNLEDKCAVVTLCHATDKCLLKNLPPLVKNVTFHNWMTTYGICIMWDTKCQIPNIYTIEQSVKARNLKDCLHPQWTGWCSSRHSSNTLVSQAGYQCPDRGFPWFSQSSWANSITD